ncbi:MAG: DUF3810 domain-containing protein [Firmicutes bacterium HGW-Firmicutes-7]|nr:MAG: DUF3810 domain-containing protein [Firmicutes bacterium HGW-Firmicutes-7]
MKNKKIIVLLILSLSLLFIKTLVIKFASENTEFIEKNYSRGIYPIISKALTSISNKVPFSIGEVLVIVFVIGICVVTFKLITYIIKKKYHKLILGISYMVFCSSLLFCIFDGVWLLNNYRTNIEDLMSLSIENNDKQALVDTFEALIIKTNSLRQELSEDDNNLAWGLSKQEILHNAYKGYDGVNQQYDFIGKDIVLVKGLLSSPIQTMSGYTGIYLFFVGEPSVNIQAPIFTIPHTACHEIAHQKGFAQEEAANYIGFLACKNNEDLIFQYSGYFSAMTYVGNAIFTVDPQIYYELTASYDEQVQNDIMYVREFWQRAQKKATSKVANHLNDAYLKAYNQPEGIKSYGRFVDLLVADFIEDGDV